MTLPDRVDVAVVGAGPAGCAAAITLCAFTSLRVALIDRAPPNRKPGEMLQPGAGELLAYLGLSAETVGAVHRPSHAMSAAWGSDQLTEWPLIFAMGQPALHVDRQGLETALRERASACGATLQLHAVRSTRKHDDGWALTFDSDEQPAQSARFLIDASGPGARFARAAGARVHTTHRSVAIWSTARAALGEDIADAGGVLVETAPEGWWYSAAVPGNGLVAALFTDAAILTGGALNSPDRWHEALARTRHTRQRLSNAGGWTSPITRPAHVQHLAPAHGADWLACGDAAITVDPLSAMGMSLGLTTGIHAGRLAAAYCAGTDVTDCGYSDEIARQHDMHVAMLDRCFAQERHWPDAPFWAARQAQRPATKVHAVAAVA